MKQTVSWFEIYTSNFNRAKQFYATVFQLELKDQPVRSERHAHMDYAVFPGDDGALVKLDKVQPGKGGTLVYFDTREINAELSRVEAAGGKVLQAKVAIGDAGFIALVEDTEGNLIGLRSQQ